MQMVQFECPRHWNTIHVRSAVTCKRISIRPFHFALFLFSYHANECLLFLCSIGLSPSQQGSPQHKQLQVVLASACMEKPQKCTGKLLIYEHCRFFKGAERKPDLWWIMLTPSYNNSLILNWQIDVNNIRFVAPIDDSDAFLKAVATDAVFPVAVCLVLRAVEAGLGEGAVQLHIESKVALHWRQAGLAHAVTWVRWNSKGPVDG